MYHITFPGGTRKTTYVGYGAPPIFHCNHNNILYIHIYIIIYMSLDWEINVLYLVSCIVSHNSEGVHREDNYCRVEGFPKPDSATDLGVHFGRD